MDLRARLERLNPCPAGGRDRTPAAGSGSVPGLEVTGEHGAHWLHRSEYPAFHLHGSIALAGWLEAAPDILGRIGRSEAAARADLRKTLFLDTETTGLSGGTGTVPFLIGIGAFEADGGFRLEQHFLRDYHEERAALASVADRLEGAELLVTYNGKCFDAAILGTRFTLSRMRTRLQDLPHIDLLFFARRIWKRRLGDCSLSNVERHVLGFEREGDIPGFAIPGIYFDYLRTRDDRDIAPVFRHNAWDILSLVALAAESARIFRAPGDGLRHPKDRIGLGRTFDSFRRHEEAAACYRRALEEALDPDDRDEVMTRLGFSLKRAGRFEAMTGVWEEMTRRSPGRILAYEELAKFHEHRSGDLAVAKAAVEAAIARARASGRPVPGQASGRELAALHRRLARLRRKLGEPDAT